MDYKTAYYAAAAEARKYILELNEKDREIGELKRECERLRTELRFNPNHDPKNGQFASKNGVDKSAGSGIINTTGRQTPRGYANQTDKALENGIKKDREQIERHKDKISNPSKYISDWDSKNVFYQKGCIKHWTAEISNFEKQIDFRQEELERRKK